MDRLARNDERRVVDPQQQRSRLKVRSPTCAPWRRVQEGRQRGPARKICDRRPRPAPARSCRRRRGHVGTRRTAARFSRGTLPASAATLFAANRVPLHAPSTLATTRAFPPLGSF